MLIIKLGLRKSLCYIMYIRKYIYKYRVLPQNCKIYKTLHQIKNWKGEKKREKSMDNKNK